MRGSPLDWRLLQEVAHSPTIKSQPNCPVGDTIVNNQINKAALPRGGRRGGGLHDTGSVVDQTNPSDDILLLHPQPEDMFDDAVSQFSSGNFKRRQTRYDHDDVSSHDSISQVGEEMADSGSAIEGTILEIEGEDNHADLFFEVVKEAATALPIKNVSFQEKEDPQITSSRFDNKRNKVQLPLAVGHKKLINAV